MDNHTLAIILNFDVLEIKIIVFFFNPYWSRASSIAKKKLECT